MMMLPQSLLWLISMAMLVPARVRGEFMSTDYDAYNSGNQFGHRPHLDFHSSREYAPLLQVNIRKQDAISSKGSHMFLRHDGNDTHPFSSPLVLDARDLSAVFMNHTFANVFGTRVQEDRGANYLTFWEGQKGDGVGNGFGLIYDSEYRLVHNVTAQNLKAHMDLHEFELTGHGTALVTGVDRVTVDMSQWAGWRLPDKNYPVLDALFQEIDLDTNEVLFSWRALDHLDPTDSFEPVARGWDIFHMNSVQKTLAGNYLVSLRHFHCILLVDGKSGRIIWTLGGKRNDFKELPQSKSKVLSFGWQHHARYLPGTNETQITLFDNHVKTTTHGTCTSDCSRGLHLQINDRVSPPTVELLREFHHPSRLQAQSQGSVQPLQDSTKSDNLLGNVFIGWGRCPTFTEHTPDGETVLDVQFSPWHSEKVPDALDNYRAYKMDWKATPWWDPVMALDRNNNQNGDERKWTVYASWNGATEVQEWIVRGTCTEEGTQGSSHGLGHVLAKSPRTGFETALNLAVEDGNNRREVEKTRTSTVALPIRYIWAEALDADGNVLRSTTVTHLDHVTVMTLNDEKQEENPVDLPESTTSSSTLHISLLTVAIVVAVLTPFAVVLAVITWRRRREYKSLEEEAKMFEVGSDEDEDEDEDREREREKLLVSN